MSITTRILKAVNCTLENQSSGAQTPYKLRPNGAKEKNLESALQSHQRALDIRIKYSGEEHQRTADCYYTLGITQHNMGDFKAALQSKQRALEIRIKLFGEEHQSTARSESVV